MASLMTSGFLRWRTGLTAVAFSFLAATSALAQSPFQIVTSSGAGSIRLAAANFKATGGDPAYQHTFDTVLFSDLESAGIFDLVAKSLIPTATPGSPSEMSLGQWSAAPASAQMVAFGNLGVQGGRLVVNGFLDDVRNTQYPQVFARQYSEEPSEDSARQIAHRFAD
jgi:TolB protein